MSRRGDNIRKRADGRWEGRYRCHETNGLIKYKSVYGKSYSETKKKLETMKLAQKEKELYMADKGIASQANGKETDFSRVAEEWLEYIKVNRKHSTYIKYLGIYSRYIRESAAGLRVAEIAERVIEERIIKNTDNRLSSNMKHSIYSMINQINAYAADHYECHTPVLKVKTLRGAKRSVQIINRSEQSRLVAYLYENLDISRLGIILCLSTGLRLGEICALKWEDIDFSQMIIHINRTVQRISVENSRTKTVLMETPPKSVFSIREIPVPLQLANLLAEYRMQSGYCVGGIKPMEPRTYQNRFKRYLKAIGIQDYNFHTLRHTFATNCIDSGMDVKSLSELLGHSDVQITLNRYVHPTMDTKRKHMNVLFSGYGQYSGQK